MFILVSQIVLMRRGSSYPTGGNTTLHEESDDEDEAVDHHVRTLFVFTW